MTRRKRHAGPRKKKHNPMWFYFVYCVTPLRLGCVFFFLSVSGFLYLLHVITTASERLLLPHTTRSESFSTHFLFFRSKTVLWSVLFSRRTQESCDSNSPIAVVVACGGRIATWSNFIYGEVTERYWGRRYVLVLMQKNHVNKCQYISRIK